MNATEEISVGFTAYLKIKTAYNESGEFITQTKEIEEPRELYCSASFRRIY